MFLKETQQNDFRVHSFWVDSPSGPLKIFTIENDLDLWFNKNFISAHALYVRGWGPQLSDSTRWPSLLKVIPQRSRGKNHEAGMEKKTKLFLNGIYLVIYPNNKVILDQLFFSDSTSKRSKMENLWLENLKKTKKTFPKTTFNDCCWKNTKFTKSNLALQWQLSNGLGHVSEIQFSYSPQLSRAPSTSASVTFTKRWLRYL